MRALLIALALGGVLVARPAAAVLPTNCTAPSPWDTFDAVGVGTQFTSAMLNRIYCVLNELGDAVSAMSEREIICQSVSIGAGQRVAVTLNTSGTLIGTEMVVPSVESDSTPPYLWPDGVHGVGGMDFQVYVWNRDADHTQAGTVCAEVLTQ